MKNIYVCAPWRDPNSILQFNQICNKIIKMGHNPVCWATAYNSLLDFSDYKNRDKAVVMASMLMHGCHEIWVFGAKTPTMLKELEAATEKNIQIIEYSILDFLHGSG